MKIFASILIFLIIFQATSFGLPHEAKNCESYLNNQKVKRNLFQVSREMKCLNKKEKKVKVFVFLRCCERIIKLKKICK